MLIAKAASASARSAMRLAVAASEYMPGHSRSLSCKPMERASAASAERQWKSTADEVIVASMTYNATANAVRHCGGVPVFVDVDPETWCISGEPTHNGLPRRPRDHVADLLVATFG